MLHAGKANIHQNLRSSGHSFPDRSTLGTIYLFPAYSSDIRVAKKFSTAQTDFIGTLLNVGTYADPAGCPYPAYTAQMARCAWGNAL